MSSRPVRRESLEVGKNLPTFGRPVFDQRRGRLLPRALVKGFAARPRAGGARFAPHRQGSISKGTTPLEVVYASNHQREALNAGCDASEIRVFGASTSFQPVANSGAPSAANRTWPTNSLRTSLS